ncbi:M61 family metallopeptidase [Flavisolibacter sp. BT320]|nr:M61 family metallopeptidase [Flavisolibacter longurius]
MNTRLHRLVTLLPLRPHRRAGNFLLALPAFYRRLLLLLIFFVTCPASLFSQMVKPVLEYVVSFPQPESHRYDVALHCSRWTEDTIRLKIPRWMPGYYQVIDYAKSVENLQARLEKGTTLPVMRKDSTTWLITGVKNKPFRVTYSIRTDRQFVANSYVDSSRAYVAPANTFLYIPNHINTPVSVRFVPNKKWQTIATGLEPLPGKANSFMTPDFDILYDCPILLGNLEELPSFTVQGIPHRFLAYKPGDFDRSRFMTNVKKIVETASSLIGDIPYRHYTFIGIGPGRGGIEHLNNTTVSFDGKGLDKPQEMNRMLNFIAHEYFHHYNVKRIRPFELGPFDYENGGRTNLLWVSEGLTVYYEYLVVKRAGLADAATFFANFNANLTAVENNPGRHHQSLQQASYSTWSDGPFGTQGREPGKSISYYDKGPLVGMLLDFEIRNATQNRASLDDVMRLLYRKYYQDRGRGFTEAELQATCEQVAGKPLATVFDYVYTTRPLDYATYLAYAGLQVEETTTGENSDRKKTLRITRVTNPTPLQAAILRSWMGE